MAKRNWYGRVISGSTEEDIYVGNADQIEAESEILTDQSSEIENELVETPAQEELDQSTDAPDSFEGGLDLSNVEEPNEADTASESELSQVVKQNEAPESELALEPVQEPEPEPEPEPAQEVKAASPRKQRKPKNSPTPPEEEPAQEAKQEVVPEPEPEPINESLLSAAIGTYRHISIPVDRIDSPVKRESQLLEFEDFSEPDWREIIDLLERRIEPCDLTGAMVDVSRKRKLWRSIEDSIAKVRVSITSRLVNRAEFRFKDRIDQDAALSDVESRLRSWQHEQSSTLAWKFNEQVNEQLMLARQMRIDAQGAVSNNHSYRNDQAHKIFGAFTRSTLLPIIFGTYLYSVLILTDNKFHSVLKYFPFFNQSRTEMAIIVAGFVSLSVLAGAWRYTSKVREAQWRFIQAQKIYNDNVILISHAYEEEVRLEQQAQHVEPLLKVLANGYSSRWVIDNSLDINVSTKLNTDELPGCFGFARAVEGSDEQTSKLRDLAVRQVVRPGWRTEIIRRVAEKYGEKSGAALTFTDLDRDIGVSQYGARDLFLNALQDMELAKRVGRDKLIETVNVIHSDVLRATDHDLRPPVMPTRSNGFEDINASSEWLVDEDRTENWVEYLGAILKEAPPFSYLNLSGTGLHGRINEGRVTSYAVVPQYLAGNEHESVEAEVVQSEILAPIDIAVRVDVSEWGTLDSFGIFEPVVHEVDEYKSQTGVSGLRG